MRKVGFLADTHSMKADGSDLPDAVLATFAKAKVDLIVHLGDIGRKAILERLAEVAPVMIQSEDRKGYVPAAGSVPDASATPVKAIDVGSSRLGLCFNLSQPDKKIAVEDGVPSIPDGALPKLLQRRFKEEVDIVAFAGTHVAYTDTIEGVLFLNPGSPTLPSDGQASVAILDASKQTPKVTITRL